MCNINFEHVGPFVVPSVRRSVRYTFVGGCVVAELPRVGLEFHASFYKMDTDSLRMIYVNFHKSICLRDFSGRGWGEEEILCRRTPPRWLGISIRHFKGWKQVV